MTGTSGRRVTADDLLRVRWPMEPALSPDGRYLAFVVSGPDGDEDRLTYRLHRRDLETGVTSVVAGAADPRRPRWAPRGDRLACITSTPGTAQVAVFEGQAVAWVTSLPGTVTAFSWSPDGRRLACAVSGEPEDRERHLPYRVGADAAPPHADGRHTIWLASWDGGHRRLLPEDRTSARSPAWSPDGTRIAFLSDDDPVRSGPTTGLWVADADDGGRRLVVRVPGPVTALAWSPDGSELAYVGHTQGSTPGVNEELWIVAAAGGPPRSISGGIDRSIGQAVRGDDERALGPTDLCWTPDGERVLAVLADGGTSGIGWFGRDGGTGMIVGGDRAVLEFDVARDDGTVAFSWSDPWNPGELSLGHLDGRPDHPCTEINQEWRSTVALASTRTVSFTAEDGASVQGWLTEPSDGGPVPLVVEVHGGPHYPVGWRFSLNTQRLAAHGYAVLRANPRGSQGYGERFATAIHGDWGGQDHRDLMGLVDAALESAPIDPRRLAIIGESYGGFMVAWTLTRTDRFSAAVSENGICDLFVAASGRSTMPLWHAQMGGPPWERPEFYVERSPITHVRAIRTPLLLLESGCDPTGQSEELFAALIKTARDVELVRTPGEGHWVNVFGRPSRRVAKIQLVDEWLSRHLTGTAATPPSRQPSVTLPEETTHAR